MSPPPSRQPMNWFGDLLFRGPLSEIEHDAWRASEAGQIALNRPLPNRIAHVLMWPVYFGEGLLAVFIGLFAGRGGQGARLPDDWMLGHRAIPFAHMTPQQLARAVWGAEGRQCFWLLLLIIAGGAVLAIIFNLLATGQTMEWLIASILFAFASAIIGGIGTRFINARSNMIRFKRAAAYFHLESGGHGQARHEPLLAEPLRA